MEQIRMPITEAKQKMIAPCRSDVYPMKIPRQMIAMHKFRHAIGVPAVLVGDIRFNRISERK
jgi:hypothetical protein